jgi:hypothetical protein
MSEESKQLSPVGDTIIDRAINDVQAAFAMRDWEFAYAMLHKAVYATADTHIIEECEKLMRSINLEKDRIKSQRGFTLADRYTNQTLQALTYLEKMDYEFFKTLMILLRPYLRYKFGPPTRATGLKQLADKLEFNRGP